MLEGDLPAAESAEPGSQRMPGPDRWGFREAMAMAPALPALRGEPGGVTAEEGQIRPVPRPATNRITSVSA